MRGGRLLVEGALRCGGTLARLPFPLALALGGNRPSVRGRGALTLGVARGFALHGCGTGDCALLAPRAAALAFARVRNSVTCDTPALAAGLALALAPF